MFLYLIKFISYSRKFCFTIFHTILHPKISINLQIKIKNTNFLNFKAELAPNSSFLRLLSNLQTTRLNEISLYCQTTSMSWNNYRLKILNKQALLQNPHTPIRDDKTKLRKMESNAQDISRTNLGSLEQSDDF